MKPMDLALIAGATLLFFTLNAQVNESQEWTLRPPQNTNSDSSMVNLRLEVNQKSGLRGWNRSSMSTDIPWASIKGLTRDQLNRGNTNVKFEIVRDAGRFLCEGITGVGRGTGGFRFEPNPNYAEQLRQMGYTSPDSEQVFSMAMHDISLEFARFIRDSGLRASTRELIDLRIHGVTREYIAEMRGFGFTELVARDFVEMKIHGVKPEFVRGLKAAGYNLTSREIVEMKIHGVTNEFMTELKQAGFNLTQREIVEMKIHGIDSQYIRELKSYGLNPPARDLVQMKIHGVRPEYLKALKDAGYGTLSSQEVTNLKIHGVSPEFIRDTKSMGYNFSLRELTEMKIHGVNTPYLQKLRASGFQNLTAAKIVKLKIHGID
jgi:hypothetical protein